MAHKSTRRPMHCPPGSIRHQVRSGESLFSIAKQYGVSLDKLLASNPQLPDPNHLTYKETICVPNQHPNQYCPTGLFRHQVDTGESLFILARKYQVNIGHLIKVNPHIHNPAKINRGDIVCIPR